VVSDVFILSYTMRKNKKEISQILFKKKRASLSSVSELAALYDIIKAVTSTLHLSETLKLITKKACQIMKAEGCSLRLLNEHKKELVLNACYGLNRLSHLRKGNLRIGESIAGRVLKESRYYIIKDLFKNSSYKNNAVARKENFRSLLSVPLVERGRAFGVLSIYSKNPNYFHKRDVRLLSIFASQASIAISNARLYEKAKANYMGAIKFLANALDAKDSYTAGHSERVAAIALNIARQLRLSELQKDAIQYASYLHDLGKVSIDINILRKRGSLTEDEWRSMSRHPQVGARIINNIESLSNLVPIILHHHAYYAGGGYPDKDMKSEGIPIGARILAVADAYEAMISHRPYRKPLSHEEACKELERCAGNQFDPKAVSAFLMAQKARTLSSN
jgi:putative nucleotidyltransferase with HDIG domain